MREKQGFQNAAIIGMGKMSLLRRELGAMPDRLSGVDQEENLSMAVEPTVRAAKVVFDKSVRRIRGRR